MKNFLKNIVDKAKETIEHASEDIHDVVEAVTEDAGKLAAQAKEKLAEAKEDFTESFGEPSWSADKAKRSFAETSGRVKEAAAGGMARFRNC
ncbi:MAG: hypothetical protein R2825_00940 [Saprospiraceae bacterium]